MTKISPITIQVAHNPYALDLNSLPPVVIPAKDSEEKIASTEKNSEKRGIFASFFKWIINEFKRDTLDSSTKEGSTEEAPQDFIERDRVQKQLQNISQMENHFREMTEEEFAATLSEHNLDINWLNAFVSQIKINREQTHLDNMQLLKLHDFIDQIKTKIDTNMQARIEKSKKYAFFSGIEAQASTWVVASAIAFTVLGIASGGTIPVIIIAAQAIAGVTAGVSEMAKGVYGYQTNLTEADLLGVTKERKQALEKIKDLSQLQHESREAVTEAYKRASALLEEMQKTTRGFIA